MTRYELERLLNLEERLVPKGNRNRTGRAMRADRIAVHNTSNTSPGADALAHSRFLDKSEGDAGFGPTSWHFTVDDDRVIKHLPLGERGIHAYASGNGVTLGIEMCMNSDGLWAATVERTARLVAALCFDFGWSIAAVKQHHDFPRSNGTQKNCPVLLRGGEGGVTWDDFIALSEGYLDGLHASEGFSAGFAVSKQAADPTGGAPVSGFVVEEDHDHADILIPDELLSPPK